MIHNLFLEYTWANESVVIVDVFDSYSIIPVIVLVVISPANRIEINSHALLWMYNHRGTEVGTWGTVIGLDA
jgi:hypothetical protein